MNWRWILLMAWRDSRKNRSRLFLFISSIILGIAALVAMNSFNVNLKKDIAIAWAQIFLQPWSCVAILHSSAQTSCSHMSLPTEPVLTSAV